MLKRLGTFALASLAIILLCTVAFWDAGAMISVTLWYFIAIFLPGFAWVYPLRQSFVETFLLANLAGFAFGAVFVILDVAFNIPMNSVTFILVPLLFIGAGVIRWRKDYFKKTAPAATSPTPAAQGESAAGTIAPKP